jgi:hypothetical protein
MSDRSNPRENPQVSAEVGYTPGMPSRPECGGAHLRFCPVPCEAMLSNLLGTSGHTLTPPILGPRGHFGTSCARLNSFLQLSRGTIRDGANDNRSDGWDMQPSSSTSGLLQTPSTSDDLLHLLPEECFQIRMPNSTVAHLDYLNSLQSRIEKTHLGKD